MIEKTEFISVRVKPTEMAAIDQAATELDISRSDFVRSILFNHIVLPTEAEPPKQQAAIIKYQKVKRANSDGVTSGPSL